MAKTSPLSLSTVLKDHLLVQTEAWRQAVEHLNFKDSTKAIHRVRILSRRLRALLVLLSRVDSFPQLTEWEQVLQKNTRYLGEARSWSVSTKIIKKIFKNNEFKDNFKAKFKGKLKSTSLWISLTERFVKQTYGLSKKLKSSKYFKKSFPKGKNKILLIPPEMAAYEFQEQKLKLAFQTEHQVRVENLKQTWQKFQKFPDLERLHRFRIAVKKWRYYLELRQLVGHPEVEPILQELKLRQSTLGAIHDLHELRMRLKVPTIRKKGLGKGQKKFLKALRKNLKLQIQQGIKTLPQEIERLVP